MTRNIDLPPSGSLRSDGSVAAGWWHDEPATGRIICDLCPRECTLKAGDRGFCFVRQNVDGEMVLTTYGRSTGFCIDPIEKKPLNHFFPGTSVLSFGTAGCNLGCKFCQNWDISKSREVERLSELAMPDAIARAAAEFGCRSVAYTYNDPVIWAEYAIDTARACRAAGIKNVAVTAGYISPAARAPFYEFMDAANVDLKGFTEEFYYKITYSHLQPVLDTLSWLKTNSDVWFEITNLIIPQCNDSHDELRQMCDWILQHVGDQVPVHFTAFHPDFRMRELPNTPLETLLAAYDIAKNTGLRHVYVGNVNDQEHQSTYCGNCHRLVIERNWYELGAYHLDDNRCAYCGTTVAGRFDARPGNWGRRRQPVQIAQFAAPNTSANTAAVSTLDRSRSRLELHNNSQGVEMSSQPDSAAELNKPARPHLTEAQQQAIQNAANELVVAPICGRPPHLADATLAGAAGLTVMGAFVTLKRAGQLRACCGALGHPMPLLEALRHSSHRTATEDARLPPISPTELPFLHLDVSLLYGFESVRALGRDRIREVVVGRHGLQIRRGSESGLLLPIVAVENQLDSEAFLRQVCRKAGLPTNAWEDPDIQLMTFEAFAFGGPIVLGAAERDNLSPARMFSSNEIEQLAAHCTRNIRALVAGGTPDYYLFGVTDGTVAGVSVAVRPAGGQSVQIAQLSVRPGLPLQATLFQSCERLAAGLRESRVEIQRAEQLEADVCILYDSAMHGTVAEPDPRGIDPAKRAVMVMDHGRAAWVFDPDCGVEQLIQIAADDCRVSQPETASLLSFAAQANTTPVRISTAPRAAQGAETREPAVAGSFYPAAAGELDQLVDELLAEPVPKLSAWPAIMVPHAGLRYSGALAARTFAQVKIPDTVLIIGPKHTRLGVEWAVAPHRYWKIPGAIVESDQPLARRLAEGIPGLELDAAAHQQEHGIEVELPWIARLAPRSRVVGITIGGGSLQRCLAFGKALAGILRELAHPPLLVISSDMNHFANDEENRRLDALALEALETKRPEHLYDVVTRHNISMCGMLPAVIIMETLRQLDALHTIQRTGYCTSADTTHDTSRVVGYAGLLLG